MESDSQPQTTDPDDSCPACPHPWSSHDRIGARFCTVTSSGERTRGCVCATTSGSIDQLTGLRR
ncbi:MAG: hypothetical protein GEU98_22055 [Pseudonocardiaceae bacterium]|nr:hypothetical protein [Pseudonocardiaceae bacterium]